MASGLSAVSASEAPTSGGYGLPGNHCRAYGRCGEVCEEAAANWGEIMRGDLTACRGKGQISRNRRGKCQGLSGVLGMEERWVTSGICQDWGRKARLGFVDVEVLGGGCRQLVAGLELEGRLQLGRHLQPSRGPVDGGCRRGRKGEESGCEA